MFTKNDITQVENLVRSLKKAKFELEGLEVMAMADVFKWVNNLHNLIIEDVRNKEMIEKQALNPKPVENAVKEDKKTKKNS